MYGQLTFEDGMLEISLSAEGGKRNEKVEVGTTRGAKNNVIDVNEMRLKMYSRYAIFNFQMFNTEVFKLNSINHKKSFLNFRFLNPELQHTLARIINHKIIIIIEFPTSKILTFQFVLSFID